MTLLTPFAASCGLGALLLARAVLGAGQGVAMPAMNNMIARWVPECERSRALSLTYSGMYMGSVLGLLLCPVLIAKGGWQSVFYSFGALGAVWWALWQKFVASGPAQSRSISTREVEYLAKERARIVGDGGKEKVANSGIPWRRLFGEKAVYAIIVAHFCVTWGYFVLLTWLPTYFNRKLGFNLASSAFLSVVPWLAMFVSVNVGGSIADNLIMRKVNVTTVRKIMQTIGFLGPALFLVLVGTTANAAVAVLYMTAALAFGSFSQSGVYSNHQDIGPSYTGVLLGIRYEKLVLRRAASLPGYRC